MIFRRLVGLLTLVTASHLIGSGAVLAEISVRPHIDGDCGADLFEGYIPTVSNGSVLPGEGVFAVALLPVADIVLPMPTKDGLATGYGAIVTFEGVAASRYAIVLSRNAGLEVLQYRPFQALPVTWWTAGSNCPAIAELFAEAGPMTLQVSGVANPSISIAVIKFPDEGGYLEVDYHDQAAVRCSRFQGRMSIRP